MKVGYVLHPYEESHASGMGYSMLEVFKQIAKRSHGYELVVYSSRPVDRSRIPGEYMNVIIPRGFIRQFLYFLKKRESDMLLFTAPLLPLWLPKSVLPVVLCKELNNNKIKTSDIREKIFFWFRDALLMPRTMRRAALVIASSAETKADIIRYYRLPSEKIRVISEGYQDWSKVEGQPETDFTNRMPFFFFTGKVKSRKNVHGIVDAFVLYKEQTGSNEHVMIAGDFGGPYYEAMAKKIHEHRLDDFVHFLGYVSPAQMRWLFENAIALVFPSISEGFGMPVVEAMSLGLPVITSKGSPMAHLSSGAAILVDPQDPSDIAQAMKQLAQDPTLRKKLGAQGKVLSADYSWDKTGEQYAQAIDSLR